MVSPVSNHPPLLGVNASKESGMGKDDFLKLLVAQLKHQDPLKPVENTEFVSQLAQFSSLEQTMGINSRLDLLAMQSKGQSNTDAVGFIGKHVSVAGNAITLDSSGTGASVGFELAGDAEKTSVVIHDQNGKTVRTLDVGKHAAGAVKVQWDGKNSDGITQPPGTYSVTIEAQSADDSAVYAIQKTQGTVTGVSFDRGYAVLTLDNGVTAPVSDLLEVQATAK